MLKTQNSNKSYNKDLPQLSISGVGVIKRTVVKVFCPQYQIFRINWSIDNSY